MALAAQVHVFEVTHCKTYLHAASSVSVVEAVQSQGLHLKTLAVPGPEAWFNDEAGEVYRYEKTWEEAKDDPVTIFHTSGTTGMRARPRPKSRQSLVSIADHDTPARKAYRSP